MKKLRVYVDTSVVGGCCDDEFRDASLSFIAPCPFTLRWRWCDEESKVTGLS